MTRTRTVIDATTGDQTTVPYTPQEETDADAAKAADDLVQAPIIANQQRRVGLSADPNFTALMTQAASSTNAQIDTWLTNNVTTLPQARTVLGALIKIVAVRIL